MLAFTLSSTIALYAGETGQGQPAAAPPPAEKMDKHTGEDGEAVAAALVDGRQRVEVVGGEYYFKPRHIVVKTGIPVELIVRKEAGLVPHDIVVKAPDAGIDFSESLDEKPKTITFTPTKPGTYEMNCTKRFLFFKSHKDRGMHGVIEVVE
jgi:plastocyanin